MKSNKLEFTRDAAFDLSRWRPAVRVPLRAYMEFNFHMDAELEKLESKWLPVAAANTWRGRRRGAY